MNRKLIIKIIKAHRKSSGDNEDLASGHCRLNNQMNASSQNCYRNSGLGDHGIGHIELKSHSYLHLLSDLGHRTEPL